MNWILLSILLFIVGYSTYKRIEERSPQNEYAYGVCWIVYIILVITLVASIARDTMPPPGFFMLHPLLLGGCIGAVRAERAALRKKIEAQLYSFCPVCASSLAEKQSGETKVLACSSCRWMQDEAK
jgi:hypothetical protein